MTLIDWALRVGMASCALPVVAALLRPRRGGAWALALAGAVSTAAYFWLLDRALGTDPSGPIEIRILALVAWAVPMVLIGHLMTAALGRESVREAFRSVRTSFLGLTAAGALFLGLLRNPAFIDGYAWSEGGGSVSFGILGKAYLSYLLVGVVFIGYNLESTLRLASGEARDRLRAPILGLFGMVGFFTYLLTTGLLYASMKLDPLIAAALPVAIANVLVAYGFLRGALTDTTVPVSRSVVYTSFTAFLAGIYVIGVGLLAQLALFTRWSPGQVVMVSIGFLVAATTLTLLFSNRLQRQLRRFIDRNFYVNRYDYRSQWFRITRSLDPAQGVDGVVRGAAVLLTDVFRADAVTIGLRDATSDSIAVAAGKGLGHADAVLHDRASLFVKLSRERRALRLDRNPEDFEYLPIYVEDREWLDATASQVVAPLVVGPYLLGVVGLERRHADDRFSYEDLDLLDNIAGHLAAVLRSVQLADALADAREMELLSQWSSMLLHDLKNYLSPIRMIARNLKEYAGNVEFQREASQDLARVADNLETLVHRLGELRSDHRLQESEIDLTRVVRKSVARLQLERRRDIAVTENYGADRGVLGDAALLERVVENLVTNAVEAMDGRGALSLGTSVENGDDGGDAWVVAWVEDTGPGMTDDFIRTRLFKPFATTKSRGLGLGLYQCRSIVQAHGGELRVRSTPGTGTRFELRLKGRVAEPAGAGGDAAAAVAVPRGRRE